MTHVSEHNPVEARDLSLALIASEPITDFIKRNAKGTAMAHVSIGNKMYAIAIVRLLPKVEDPGVHIGTIGHKKVLTLQPGAEGVRYSDPRLTAIYDDLVEVLKRTKPDTGVHGDLKDLVKRARDLIDTEETLHADR